MGHARQPRVGLAGTIAAALIGLLGASCEGSGPETVSVIDNRVPTVEGACFGGVRSTGTPEVHEFYPPAGWYLFTARVGRCSPLERALAVRVGEHGLFTVPPSQSPASTEVAWLGWVNGPFRVTVGREGDDDAFVDRVRWQRFRRRPSVLPAGARMLTSERIRLEPGLISVTVPARLRASLPTGVHTLSADLGLGTTPPASVQVTVHRAGSGQTPLLERELTRAGTTPMTVSYAASAPGPLELWLGGAQGMTVNVSDLRIDSRALPDPIERRANPTERRRALDRVPVALGGAAPEVTSAGTWGPALGDCLGSYLVPAPSEIRFTVPSPRILRGALGMCEPTWDGAATWLVSVGDGEPLFERELRWQAYTDLRAPFSIPLPAGEVHMRIEGGGPTAWWGVRPVIPIGPDDVRSSGFQESAMNRNYAPENVLDGDPDTEWHALESRGPGWIELSIDPPAALSGIAIMNGRNPSYHDRGAAQIGVAIYEGEHTVLEAVIDLGAFDENPTLGHYPVSVEQADRVRLTVEHWHRRGPALAEVELY